MFVIDPYTGKKAHLEPTTELISDLSAFENSFCTHTNVAIRKRVHKGGGLHFYRQCLVCGEAQGSALKRSPEFENCDPWDESLFTSYNRTREDTRIGIKQRHLRKQKAGADGSKRKYDTYLESPEWKARRAKVLVRANGICEGCLTNKATEVHHKTYKHIFEEFMFELVAVCEQCHDRLHPERLPDDETVSEWSDGFPCDGCRWQAEKDHRRWCGELDMLAVDALAPNGECGPKQKMLEPLK